MAAVETYFPTYRVVRVRERPVKLEGQHISALSAVAISEDMSHIILISAGYDDRRHIPFSSYYVWNNTRTFKCTEVIEIYNHPSWGMCDCSEDYVPYEYGSFQELLEVLERVFEVSLLPEPKNISITEIDNIIF